MAFTSSARLKQTAVVEVAGSGQSNAKPAEGLFSDLSKDDVAEIIRLAHVSVFARGRIIIRGGDPARRLFLIKKGSVDLYRLTSEGREVRVVRLGPGEAFGLATFLEKPSYLATAEALEKTELYTWERQRICQCIDEHPRLGTNILRIALQYITTYSDKHLALVSESTEDRLTRTLALLGVRTGQWDPRGLKINITNERLASLADVDYYTTSRLLSKWHRKGAVEKRRGEVIVRFPEKMLDLYSLPDNDPVVADCSN